MRRLLIDHSRTKNSEKRGGGAQHIDLDHIVAYYEDRGLEMIKQDEALTQLGSMDANLAQLVELRFFGARTNAQTADVLGDSERTIERSWSTARAWLRNQFEHNLDPTSGDSKFS
jgi:RNA polymerase sigma-70 factor (ECF subfamily)